MERTWENEAMRQEYLTCSGSPGKNCLRCDDNAGSHLEDVEGLTGRRGGERRKSVRVKRMGAPAGVGGAGRLVQGRERPVCWLHRRGAVWCRMRLGQKEMTDDVGLHPRRGREPGEFELEAWYEQMLR